MSCASSKLLNHSPLRSALEASSTAAREPMLTSAPARRLAIGDCSNPGCKGTMAKVLGRAVSVWLRVVSCRRLTSTRIIFRMTRGWRPISASNAAGGTRKSSLSRIAMIWAECVVEPEIIDISPTVSPAGTCATRRRLPRSSSAKTPRLPEMTRNTAWSFSPSRLSSMPPGRPNQLASDSSFLIAASLTSSSSGKPRRRWRSDSG